MSLRHNVLINVALSVCVTQLFNLTAKSRLSFVCISVEYLAFICGFLGYNCDWEVQRFYETQWGRHKTSGHATTEKCKKARRLGQCML